MKIAIDISQIVYEGTGTATLTKNLLQWLPKIDTQNEYLFFGSSLRRQAALRLFTKKVFPFPPTFLDFVWNRLHILPVESLIGKIDIWHSSDWTQPPAKAKKVAPILDMVVYKYPQTSDPRIVATQLRRLRWVKKEADRIITISQSSKRDIIEILGIPAEKISVVYLAAGEEFRPQSPEKVVAVREKYHLDKDYFLTVGTREPRKNLDRVVAATLKIKAELAIAGKGGWGIDNEKFKMQNVKLLGFVPQEDLPALYAGAKGFVYPSLYEGFGVPVLEAMACGCPVITSNIGSLPEVGGEAAFYVYPESIDDIAGKMADCDRSLVEKGKVQAAKFSWQKTAEATLKVYQELV